MKITFEISKDVQIELHTTSDQYRFLTDVDVYIVLNEPYNSIWSGTDTLFSLANAFGDYAKMALNNELSLSQTESIGTVGYLYNRQTHDFLADPVNVSVPQTTRLCLFAGKVPLFLYNADGIVYIEASPTFDFYQDEDYTEADVVKWLQNYEPYFVVKMDEDSLNDWSILSSSIAQNMMITENELRHL